jgi:RNA polymerase subunit RPABC4/transcription elongation factor Spt4
MACPTLTKCIECGRTVSSDAERCPHCHKFPRICYCAICGGTMKPEDDPRPRPAVELPLAHPSCLESVGSQKFHCPVCKGQMSIRDVGSWQGLHRCEFCDHPFAVEFVCHQCGMWMPKNTQVEVKGLYYSTIHRYCLPGAKKFVLNNNPKKWWQFWL